LFVAASLEGPAQTPIPIPTFDATQIPPELSHLDFSQIEFNPGPFHGLTPENMDELIAPHLARAAVMGTPEEKGAAYAQLVIDLSGRMGPNVPLLAKLIELADLALAYPQTIGNLTSIRTSKGNAIVNVYRIYSRRRQDRTAKAMEARRDLTLEYLASLVEIPEARAEFDRDHPDFDPERHPSSDWAPTFPLPVQVYAGTGASLMPPELRAADEAWSAARKEHQSLAAAERVVPGLRSTIVGMHRLPPFDFDWLGQEARERHGFGRGGETARRCPRGGGRSRRQALGARRRLARIGVAR
jgi:hypothetical protein